ncbi:SurA N-terminal domain-containing protein [Candidatus Saccharibacteria bacterium]|nr:SurA N-terminal domain-containing protein [Candidatus Saccharibacteria bacterium]
MFLKKKSNPAPPAKTTGDTAPQVTASLMFSRPSKNPFNFIKQHTKLVLFILIGVLLLAGGTQYFMNRDVYMIVAGRVITKSQFNEAKKANENYINAVGGLEQGSTEDPNFVRNQLIFMAALENEAAKAGITVSQEEVDTSLAQLAASLPKEYKPNEEGSPSIDPASRVRSYQKDIYAWSPAYSNDKQKSILLQTRLKTKLLNQIDVLQVSLVLNPSSGLDAQSGKGYLQGRISSLLKEQNGTYADLVTVLRGNNQNLNVEFLPDVANITKYPDLSAKAGEVIGNLTSPGQISAAVQTEENVLQIYRLEASSQGDYDSWESLVGAYASKAHIITSWFDWKRFTI